MATTVSNASLVVTIVENIILNNQSIDSTNYLTIASINEVDKRIVTVPFASEVTLLNFGTAVAAGTFIAANVKYIRITNKDATNYVRIRMKKTGADTFDIKLEAGKSLMLGNPSESVSATAAAWSAFVTADSINAQANTANVDVEIFIALT